MRVPAIAAEMVTVHEAAPYSGISLPEPLWFAQEWGLNAPGRRITARRAMSAFGLVARLNGLAAFALEGRSITLAVGHHDEGTGPASSARGVLLRTVGCWTVFAIR